MDPSRLCAVGGCLLGVGAVLVTFVLPAPKSTPTGAVMGRGQSDEVGSLGRRRTFCKTLWGGAVGAEVPFADFRQTR